MPLGYLGFFVMITINAVVLGTWSFSVVTGGITFNGGFVATTEKISKIRFIMISVMPYFLISILFPIILGACNVLNIYIVALIVVNAMASSVDVLNLLLILFQTPKNSYIINNGFETYFK